ncbi:MAG: glycerol-3-phosphate dehydrogenase/oxidase [Candidatus Hydrogenedentota bacterium]
MNRIDMLQRVQDAGKSVWDIVIVGGGATGLGTAVDSASRGYKTLLLEQHDFAKGTSSRSTKLVHGGVRYLQQGNLSLVLEALRERGLLKRNAPHLVRDLPFIVPNYDWWEAPFYGIGLRMYDMLAGKHGLGASKNLSMEETVERLPTIETHQLRGGVQYFDGQFDDARLAINLAQTAVDQGAVVLNYCPVTELLHQDEMVSGLRFKDLETKESYDIHARVVINATGIFTDNVRRMDDSTVRPMVTLSQGIHVVLPRRFLGGDTAIMVPHTDDGRVLFAIPWHDCVVVGTTDTPMEEATLEPRALPEEIEFIMTHAARYLTEDPEPSDVLSVFAGLRPLVSEGDDEDTAAISRDHTISISRTGLLTVTGGKWTTYRKMAEDTVEHAVMLGSLDDHACATKELNIHGYHQHAEEFDELEFYGSDAIKIREIYEESETHADRVHELLNLNPAQIIWAVRNEMARTVEDVLARRSRCLLLNARASIEAASNVAQIMAVELDCDEAWVELQVQAYAELASGYLME